jgi:undecaprenyl-diphosphatase
LGIPTIAAAALVEGRKLVQPLLLGQALPADMAFPAGSAHPAILCAVGVLVAALAGYGAIGLLDRFTQKPRLGGFALYCLGAGALLIFLGLR